MFPTYFGLLRFQDLKWYLVIPKLCGDFTNPMKQLFSEKRTQRSSELEVTLVCNNAECHRPHMSVMRQLEQTSYTEGEKFTPNLKGRKSRKREPKRQF